MIYIHKFKILCLHAPSIEYYTDKWRNVDSSNVTYVDNIDFEMQDSDIIVLKDRLFVSENGKAKETDKLLLERYKEV